MARKSSASGCKIIAIGASAGGLTAIRNFFEALPSDTGMSFVVVMHLSPQHKSNLDELLASKTSMTVTQVNHTVRIEPDHVYVIPPNKRLETDGSELSVFDFEEPHGKRAPIDHFFRSLSKCPGAGGIIFSGAGTDGSVGLKSIKEAGGLVLVQDPEEAEYDSMPNAAIDTGLVDVVLPVRDMALRLVDMNKRSKSLEKNTGVSESEKHPPLQDILAMLRVQTGHDFSSYKYSTLLRRVKRRMQVTGQDELEGYLGVLENSPEESEALLNDLLIGVTNFFRDPEAFDMLKTKVFPELFKSKTKGAVRIWSVGCSTGEEVYSLAMLLEEYASSLEYRPKIQIFATDIDKQSLTIARRGLYPHAIEADVSEDRLRRFFEKEKEHYRIHRRIRERVLFSEHNALQDPPFSRIDLITCRNLLIYLNRDPQDQVFNLFHYALRPEGYLFLGSSESADNVPELFRLTDKQHRLYKAKNRSSGMPRMISYDSSGYPKGDSSGYSKRSEKRQEVIPEAELHRLSLEEFSPPSLLVDENHHIIHISERAGRYMEHPGGTITSEVTRLVGKELRSELRLALLMVFEGKATVARPVKMQIEDRPVLVYLTVRPAPQKDEDGKLALVLFNEADDFPETPPDENSASPPYEKLKEELYYASQRLKTVSREYEASREELQAQNEELLSINEEYKSTMEELETSKEEIESINEELETVNSELTIKIDEVSKAHNNLQNLFSATEISTVFLDRELNIVFYTPWAEKLFNIREIDQGRPFSYLTHKLNYDHLEEDSREVIDKETSFEREICDEEGQWFLVRLHPYQDIGGVIDGVVITFIDISELKITEHALREEKEYAELLFDTVHEGVLVLDRELCIQSATTSFYELFHTIPEETIGKRLYQLGNNQWDIPELRKLLDEIVSEDKQIKNYEVEHFFEGIGRRIMLLNVRQVVPKNLILMAIQDVTDYKTALDEVRELNDTLEERVRERTGKLRHLASRLTMSEQGERNRISGILHDDLQQVLFAISMNIELVQKDARKGAFDDLTENLTTIQKYLKLALEKTRNLTSDLNPSVLKSENLTEILDWLVKWFGKSNPLKIELKAENEVRIPHQGIRIILLQIVRELLFNIVKHGGTDHAQIIHGFEDEQVVIHVIDAGKGFDKQKLASRERTEQGYGLASVQERLNFQGGELEIDSEPGKGTRMSVRIPVEQTLD